MENPAHIAFCTIGIELKNLFLLNKELSIFWLGCSWKVFSHSFKGEGLMVSTPREFRLTFFPCLYPTTNASE